MSVAMIGPKFYAWDKNGKPLEFGKLYTYQARTNTPKDTYQSEDQQVANDNPVILNGEGYANIYLSGSYKMVLKDKNENEIWTSDPVSASSATEWVKCLSATYLSPTSFKVNGNFVADYEVGRRVRIDNAATEYAYSTIKSSVFAAGETTITIPDAVITTGIVEACISIVGPESTSSIYNLSESFEFDTIEDMSGSEIEFPEGKALRVIEGDILYKVTSGSSPDNSTSPNLTGFGYAARKDQDIISADEYATFGGNVVVDSTALNHTAGTVEILDAAINVLADTYYRVTVDITTTTSGFVKIFFGNDTVPGNQVEAIFGDQTNGFWFSNATILTDGTENNRQLTTNVYTFALYTSATAFDNLHIETDLLWGGNIGSVTIQEVTEKPAYSKITPSDGVGRDFYTGIKGGSVNRNDMAIGDKSALGMFVFDGLSPTPAHNVAVGSRTLSALQHGDENTGIGTFALQGNEGSNNTAIGYSALKVCNKGQENTAMGYKAGTFVTTGYKNTFLGFWSGAGIRTGRENVDIGWKSNLEPSDRSFTTSIGASSGMGVNIGDANTFIGRNAANSISETPTLNLSASVSVGADSKPWGNNSVCVGFQSKVGTEIAFADFAISIGDNATTFSEDSIAIGHVSVANGVGSISLGDSAQTTAGSGCISIGANSISGADEGVAIGKSANGVGSRCVSIGSGSSAASQSVVVGGLATPAGTNNTAVGFRAGNNFDGSANTFLGHTAGLQAVETFSNCTLLGSLTVVTGSNQVQLGDSATTTYAYGAVQDRSDKRDKLDIKDLTDAHIAFFMDIEWKQYRMNHRERYIDIVEHVEIEEKPIFHELHPKMVIGTEEIKHVTYERVEVENDGSRSGKRFHIGAIAQQVEAAMKKHNVDFAGLQHHSVNDGQDVYTIGYQEFIGIQGLIIQRQQTRLLSIEGRLTKAGI